MATKPKRVTFTSPKGTFLFPALNKPDYGNEKFPKPDGEFKTGLVVPLADAQPLIDKLMPVWQAAILEGQEHFAQMDVKQRKKFGSLTEQMFYEPEYDKETEDETGNVIFKFKTKYKITDSKTKDVRFNKIDLFDAAGKPLSATTLIYGGTVGKVSFQARGYWVAGQAMAGITLLLNAAQVITLVGPGNRTASSFGFGQEDGYVGDDSPFEGEDAAPSKGADGNPEDF